MHEGTGATSGVTEAAATLEAVTLELVTLEVVTSEGAISEVATSVISAVAISEIAALPTAATLEDLISLVAIGALVTVDLRTDIPTGTGNSRTTDEHWPPRAG